MDHTKLDKLFDEFYEKGDMKSSYKCAFLYALADVGTYEKHELIEKKIIHMDGTSVNLDLHFISARFIRYYLEIVNSDIQHVNPKMADPNPSRGIKILDLIKNYNLENQSLESLSKPNMIEIRNEAISEIIIREPLTNIKKDLDNLIEKPHSKNILKFELNLLDYFEKNVDDIKTKLKLKLKKHLEKENLDKQFSLIVSEDNPFYEYCKKFKPSLFLIGITEVLEDDFEKSMLNKIQIVEHKSKKYENVHLWGLQNSIDNQNIWNNIKIGDYLMFVKNGICIGVSNVKTTFQNQSLAIKIWGEKQFSASRDLLIVMDAMNTCDMDLQNSQVQIIDPMIPSQHRFPIIQVKDEKVDLLISSYGNLENVFDSFDEHKLNDHPLEKQIKIVKGNRNTRIGQQNFREQILKNYNNCCAICGIEVSDLLEASHILPVGNKETSGDINNGICLCVLHHKMFDRGYLYFTDDYEAKLLNKFQNIKQLSEAFKSKVKIQNCNILPSKKHLKTHREIHDIKQIQSVDDKS